MSTKSGNQGLVKNRRISCNIFEMSAILISFSLLRLSKLVLANVRYDVICCITWRSMGSSRRLLFATRSCMLPSRTLPRGMIRILTFNDEKTMKCLDNIYRIIGGLSFQYIYLIKLINYIFNFRIFFYHNIKNC